MNNRVSKNQSNPDKIELSQKAYLVFKCHYPEENPKDAVESITDALNHIGVFDNLNKVSPKES